MSIARVRIAPVERWCEASLERHSDRMHLAFKAVGAPISIQTETCEQSHFCEGRYWRCVPESLEELRDQIGSTTVHMGIRICEHMLEMD
jgi:hypothetical protein